MSRISLKSLLVVTAALAAAGYVAQQGARAQVRQQQNAQAQAPAQQTPDQEGMQCPMMAGLRGIELRADSPAVLHARAEELGLDEQQIEQLTQIQQSARQQAQSVLTDEQRQKLENDPQGPLSMMQLSRLRMRGMKRDGMSERMCPMCERMMQRQKGEEGSPRR